jgi:hypothetical protein
VCDTLQLNTPLVHLNLKYLAFLIGSLFKFSLLHPRLCLPLGRPNMFSAVHSQPEQLNRALPTLIYEFLK